jgi:hypothetical protein
MALAAGRFPGNLIFAERAEAVNRKQDFAGQINSRVKIAKRQLQLMFISFFGQK